MMCKHCSFKSMTKKLHNSSHFMFSSHDHFFITFVWWIRISTLIQLGIHAFWSVTRNLCFESFKLEYQFTSSSRWCNRHQFFPPHFLFLVSHSHPALFLYSCSNCWKPTCNLFSHFHAVKIKSTKNHRKRILVIWQSLIINTSNGNFSFLQRTSNRSWISNHQNKFWFRKPCRSWKCLLTWHLLM